MTIDEFWSLIEKSRASWDLHNVDGNQRNQMTLLTRLLSELVAAEVASFEQHLVGQLHGAYRWDLWHAATIIADGCSDDFFANFRGWLVSMGRDTYEAALGDVETLAESAAMPGIEDVFFEGFSTVAADVFAEKVGRLVGSTLEHPTQPAGVRIAAEEFPARFPRLWAKYRAG